MALVLLLSAATADARPKTSFVPGPHPAATIKKWQRHHRWLDKYKPFVYPDGSRWAVPYPIAWCESGGDYYVGPSGAYGLIPPFPQWMSPRQQDETAHDLYRELGESPWAPYESGCAYR